MTMWLTESDLQQVKGFACLSVANKLRIPDAEFQSIPDLQEKILAKNQGLAAVLAAFLAAYDEWYQFHVRTDDKAGKLDSAENMELMRLIQERDGTRNSLLKRLAAVV